MFGHQKVLLFDFETTGLNPLHDEIIEIGAILLEKDVLGQYVIIKEMSQLVMASKPLPAKIIEITHITDQILLRDGVSQEEAFQSFMQLYDTHTLLIAYNIQFDLSFLNTFFRRHYQQNFILKNDILDVMAIYKDRHRYPHRLDQAVQTYQVSVKNTHRALDDVKATYEVLMKMNQELPNIYKYVNVIGYNPSYGVSGLKLPHVRYTAQRGGMREIEKN